MYFPPKSGFPGGGQGRFDYNVPPRRAFFKSNREKTTNPAGKRRDFPQEALYKSFCPDYTILAVLRRRPTQRTDPMRNRRNLPHVHGFVLPFLDEIDKRGK